MQEKELATRAIQGNEQAILQLLHLHKEKYYRIAYAYCRNEQDALDAIQELTYKTLKKIHTVKDPSYLHTWLVRVLINICLDSKRKTQHIVLAETMEEPVSQSSLSFEMSDIIQQLSQEQQELIYMKYFQNLKNQDIAQIKRIPEGTVKSRLHTTLKKLRALIGKGD